MQSCGGYGGGLAGKGKKVKKSSKHPGSNCVLDRIYCLLSECEGILDVEPDTTSFTPNITTCPSDLPVIPDMCRTPASKGVTSSNQGEALHTVRVHLPPPIFPHSTSNQSEPTLQCTNMFTPLSDLTDDSLGDTIHQSSVTLGETTPPKNIDYQNSSTHQPIKDLTAEVGIMRTMIDGLTALIKQLLYDGPRPPSTSKATLRVDTQPIPNRPMSHWPSNPKWDPPCLRHLHSPSASIPRTQVQSESDATLKNYPAKTPVEYSPLKHPGIRNSSLHQGLAVSKQDRTQFTPLSPLCLPSTQKIYMVNVPKLGGRVGYEGKESLINKAIHWIRHVRGCRSGIRDDIARARRCTSPDRPLDRIELTLKGVELTENLLALEYQTCSPDASLI